MELAALSGKSEDYPAWSTKFVALMHTKGLFRTVMGYDDLPEAEPTPRESECWSAGNLRYQDAGASSVILPEEKQSKHSVVPPGSGAQQHHFDVHKERLRGNRWLCQ